jgi:polysaccharide export outer membrane protein
MDTSPAQFESVFSTQRRFLKAVSSRRSLLREALALATLFVLAGCETVAPTGDSAPAAPVGAVAAPAPAEVLTLKEGDTLHISFPGVPTMDTTQQVRQDGRINLPMLGEYVVTGKTTDGLTKELEELYAPKLVSKEVTVTLVSSSYIVYVTGAVLSPGKVQSNRPISAFEAVMNAGGFDMNRANLESVTIIREENGQTRNYTVNLQLVLEGKSPAPFYLKRSDTVYVPVKFSLF